MKTGLILVAAGYGSVSKDSRWTSVSKLLEDLSGLQLFLHPLIAAESAGLLQTVIVANPLYKDQMEHAVDSIGRVELITNWPTFVVQYDRYGSADAVLQAIPAAQELGMDRALIVYGDMPLWSPETMRLVLSEDSAESILTMVTVERHEWFPALDRYGRVVRDPRGAIARVVEVNTATPCELATTTVNPSLWIWDLRWLSQHIPTVEPVRRPDGRCDEVYMPPLVEIAYRQGLHINEVRLPAKRSFEALGVNSREDLELVRSFNIEN